MKLKLQTSDVVKIILVFLVVLFSVLFYFREPIKEHKVTKAKMEMFKRMLKTEPEQWGEEFHEVFDSMIVNNQDSIANSLIDIK